jgi:hypothetical protein
VSGSSVYLREPICQTVTGEDEAIAAEGVCNDRIAARIQIRLMNPHNEARRLDIKHLAALSRLDTVGNQLRPHRPVEEEQALLQSVFQTRFTQENSLSK